MMAAGRAAERGKRVLLLEKNAELGKKLLISGGGRCNITNNKPDVRLMQAQYSDSGKFLAAPFTEFGVSQTLEFFRKRGLYTVEENDGRLFPSTFRSESVRVVLERYMTEGAVTIKKDAEVIGIAHEDGKFTISLKQSESIKAANCILSTGGLSRPETGSTGEGFKWLESLGHTIVQSDMALVPLALHDGWPRAASGVSLPDIKLTVFQGSKKQFVQRGKILFTHVGISGPTVLNMSKKIGALLRESEALEYQEGSGEVVIMLDLFPTLDHGAMRERLQDLLVTQSNKMLKNVIADLIPPSLVEPLFSSVNIDGATFSHSVRTETRKSLVALLKAVPLHVAGLLGKDKAVISSGGVSLDEIDWKMMRSLKVPGLYIVGDVLNIDRPSGGYSLQLCWTTGYIAGSSC